MGFPDPLFLDFNKANNPTAREDLEMIRRIYDQATDPVDKQDTLKAAWAYLRFWNVWLKQPVNDVRSNVIQFRR